MRRVVFALAFFAHVFAARAATQVPIPLTADAQAKITLSSCFNRLPPAGYAPVEITINNSASYAQSWTFHFQSPAYAYRGDSLYFETSLAVPAQATRSFKLLVPLALNVSDLDASSLQVQISGPGDSNGARGQFPSEGASSEPPSAFIGISDSLAAVSWSALQKDLKDHKVDLVGSRFAATELPEDWRAYVGIAALWLSAEELRSLNPMQRSALHDYVLRGGEIFLQGNSGAATELAPNGFGKVVAGPAPDLEIEKTSRLIRDLPTSLNIRLTSDYRGGWPARTELGEIKPNVPVLIGFIIAFAALIGPINLFLFAGKQRRHRLFWTTPLISVGASLLLYAFIILEDGFGGTGLRIGIVQIFPSEKKSVLLQEQISRTGIVRHSDFETRDPIFIAPITLDEHSTATRQLQNAGQSFGGEWFKSRALQAHWIESITSTRAEVTVVNSNEIQDGKTAPIILSTIGVSLDRLYFRDQSGNLWEAGDVRTGEKKAMRQTNEIPALLPAAADPHLGAFWKQDERGYFYASSTDPAGLIETLPAIRWKKQRVLYCGRVSVAAVAP